MIHAIISYFDSSSAEYVHALWQHIAIAVAAVTLAIVAGFPLGVLSSRNRVARSIVTGTLSTLRVIPSLALLFLIVVLTGQVGFQVALFALTVLALPPVMINTTVAFSHLPPATVEAAEALGMSSFKIFWQVKLPLAAPVVFAGIKTATTEVIASATLAAFIGGGGLGTLIFTGLGLMRTDLLVIGGASVAALSLASLALLNLCERRLIPWKHLPS
ncbi:MAG: ABC transporter permease [Coriobacteriia bacterium]|nr:ABC transporter permease [Coriobacteriia bacterium]MCL2536804.1 ABC transporter permease [Coriobacteriia bacterium]